MPYRPQKRRASRPGNGTGNGTHHRGSYAARLAIARSTARKKGPSGPNAVIVVFLILLVSGVTLASAAAITAGGAAAVTIATLDQGLPDVKAFRDIDFSEESVMTTRNGKVDLAKFWDQRREVIGFEDIPKIVLDATTATEDDTFWDNPGVDLEATINALVTEAGGGGSRGGGSTITQQLVRAVLLPEDVIANQDTKEGVYLRKAKEILQAYKLTQAFPGEEGKKDIITAYLNEIPYGAAYGVSAAAEVYFGKNLDQLTVSEAALLAAIPQEPGNLYPYKAIKGKYVNVVKEKYGKKSKKNGKQKTRLVIKTCGDKPDCKETALVNRRNFILQRLKDGKGRWTSLSDEQFQQALNEKIVIKKERKIRYKAPWFVEAALKELALILGDRDPVNVGGYKITTTLDWKAQQLGEKYIYAGAVVPNLPASKYYDAIKKNKLGRDAGWIGNLRGLNLRNGALVALDYRTGDILAYVGSAGYYRRSTPKFDAKFDHVGLANRQPGSAWKPIVYATGFETRALTAGSVLLDITTPFGGVTADGKTWAPKDADSRDRGPILVRDALQQSLNVPAIRALDRTGVKTVRKYAVKAGFKFLPEPLGYGDKSLDVAGLAGAIGTVEVRPLDMASAFGAFGNGGKVTRPRYILKVEGPKGEVIYEAGKPVTTQVWSPQTAYIMADILKGNADPAENAVWADTFAMYNTKNGTRRELGVKTGTTNNLKDYSTYGFLPIPNKGNQPALSVGVWYGNSDSTPPNLSRLVYSLDNAGKTWAAFVRDYMNKKPAPTFKRPKAGVVTATIRNVTGSSRQEIFIRGTQPGGKNQVDPVYSCGSTSISDLENPGAPSSWLAAVNAWASRSNGSTSQWGSVKTALGSCYYGGSGGAGTNDGGSSSGNDSSSNNNGNNSNNSSSNNSGGNNSGGGSKPAPAPTCRPGYTDKPKGCVISF